MTYAEPKSSHCVSVSGTAELVKDLSKVIVKAALGSERYKSDEPALSNCKQLVAGRVTAD